MLKNADAHNNSFFHTKHMAEWLEIELLPKQVKDLVRNDFEFLSGATGLLIVTVPISVLFVRGKIRDIVAKLPPKPPGSLSVWWNENIGACCKKDEEDDTRNPQKKTPKST